MDPRAGRPSAWITARVLTLGTLAATGLLLLGFGLRLAGVTDESAAHRLTNVGVLLLLATPAAGLLATYIELRAQRPKVAWLALAVLAVMGLSSALALASR
jgi:hypothetical protein